MSWLGLTHKGTEPLYSDEWNRVVDALDILYGYVAGAFKVEDLTRVPTDIIPDQDNLRDLGTEERSWKQVHAYYGYFKGNVLVQGKSVIKDGDPIQIAAFIESAKQDIEKLYSMVSDLNSKIQRTLLQFEDGALGIDTRFAQRIEIGYAFSASHRFEGVPSDESRDVFFENPSTSGRDVNIIAIEVALLGQAWIDIYRDNTRIAGGTRIPVFNLNLGSGIEPKAIPEYGGQYTPGVLAHSTVAPGGRLVRVLGSVVEVGERVKVPPGYNLLVRVTNKAGVTTDFSVRLLWWEDVIKGVLNASGIDPNDPTWTPAGGWDKVWEFETDAELTDFATGQRYASVSDHRVIFEPPSDDYGYVERDITDEVISKVAICLKDIVSSAPDIHMIVGVDIDDGTSVYSVSLYTVAGDPSKLELYDENSGNSVVFTNPNDWIVFVVDYVNKIARVYDRNKNVLAELSLTADTSVAKGYWVHVEEYNVSAVTIDDVEVDWIAIKY